MTVGLKDPPQYIIQSPYSRFLYALNSPETKKRYTKRFEVFLDFMDIEGSTIEERLYSFYQRTKSDSDWLQDSRFNLSCFKRKELSKVKLPSQQYQTTTNLSSYSVT